MINAQPTNSKVYIITNLAPHYRAELWKQLLLSEVYKFYFFFGENGKNGIKEIDFTLPFFAARSNQIRRVKNLWYKKSHLIWQVGPIAAILKTPPNEIIILGDVKCLSSWLICFIAKFKNIKVTMWGHGLYGDEEGIKKLALKTFFSLADKHLVYERRAKNLLISEGFDSNSIHVVFNSLDFNTQNKFYLKNKNLSKNSIFNKVFDYPENPIVTFIGRITPEKKINILLKAANDINGKSAKINVLIIGGGHMDKELKKMSKKGLDDKWLHFTGACYEEDKISKYLISSDLCVSPGNIGLTAIHALTYGLPVATHSNLFNQGPEVATIVEGKTGFLFKENDFQDLKRKLIFWLFKRTNFERDTEECRKIVTQYYNPDYQLKVFQNLLNNFTPLI